MKLSRFSPRFYVAFAIVTIIGLFGFIGPLIFTKYTVLTSIGGFYDEPSGKAWLGTDHLGHDIFTLLVEGTRTSLIVGLVSGLIATLIGVVIGTTAGYLGGAIEETLMAATNVMLAIPQIVILILISLALESRTAMSVAIVIAVTSWPWTARAVRAQASSVRTREHLDIARLSGANTFSIILFDVVPYMLSYVVMVFVLQVSGAILSEAALSLLGLGPSSIEDTSLGMVLHWALVNQAVGTGAWWAFLPPTLLLTFIAFGFLLLQSSLDEIFNPRLRRDSGRKWRKMRKRAAGKGTTPVSLAASAGTSSGNGV